MLEKQSNQINYYIMLKNILNLDGAQQLSKNEQKEINGGLRVPKLCNDGGVQSNINSCLCISGTFNLSTNRCTNANPTGNIFENATSCCYGPI
jgi:hypothetical protein